MAFPVFPLKYCTISQCEPVTRWISLSFNSSPEGGTAALYCSKSAQFIMADRKSTRLNSSHTVISYAVFCLKKKKKTHQYPRRLNQTQQTSVTAAVQLQQSMSMLQIVIIVSTILTAAQQSSHLYYQPQPFSLS